MLPHRMKKNLLLLSAPLLLSSAPFLAHATVSLYGAVDTNLQWSQKKYSLEGARTKATRFGLDDGYIKSNIWGLKGTEKINKELDVFFNLENKFNLSDGSSKGIFTNKSFVGLRHKTWGSFSIGRQKSSSDEVLAVNMVRGMGKVSRAFGGSGVTADSLIKYQSPSINGLTLGISHARKGSVLRSDTHELENDFEHYTSVAARYQQGPWQLSASYDRKRGLDNKNHAKDFTLRGWVIGSVYDFEVVKLSLAYGRDYNGKFNNAGNIKNIGGENPKLGGKKVIGFYNRAGFKSKNYYVGISVPIEQWTWAASWTHTSSNMGALFYEETGRNLPTASQNIYATQLSYPLSKRTTVYAYGAYGTNLAYLKNLSAKEFGIGLSHRF